MLTIQNIEKELLNNVITLSRISVGTWLLNDSYWKIVKVYWTDFQYRIDLIETHTNKECYFSLLRNKENQFGRYILYTYVNGKKLKHVHLTKQTLSTPKDFLFQLECSLLSMILPV
jgi:hypothetical protein